MRSDFIMAKANSTSLMWYLKRIIVSSQFPITTLLLYQLKSISCESVCGGSENPLKYTNMIHWTCDYLISNNITW